MIGRDGGRQDLSLGPGCYRKGIALHELMHLLGFFHEQSRIDRNQHVYVLYKNADIGKVYIKPLFLCWVINVSKCSDFVIPQNFISRRRTSSENKAKFQCIH